jgi:FdhE protein
MKKSKWDLRIERADHLAEEHPFAAQALRFFKDISRLQARLYYDLERQGDCNQATTSEDLRRGDLPVNEMALCFPEFLSGVGTFSPEPLSRSARVLIERGPVSWREVFASSWQGAGHPMSADAESEAALGRMFLQPFAEYLADKRAGNGKNHEPAACPFCFEKPLVGVLRPEGDGGKRSLICSMCATEWDCGRILCPACGEQDVEKLAVYTADEFRQVRIEACDTCRYYLKTVDLTKTGRAIPVVDELATLPLNLWANDHGYKKLQTNLLGL